MIKMNVGAITFGFLLTTFVETGGGADANYNDDASYNTDQKLTRAFCKSIVVLRPTNR